jgi:hypothetical protein
MGEKRNVYRSLVGNPETKRPLGRPRRKWVDNIKIVLEEVGLSVVDWIGLAQDRYRWNAHVNAKINLRRMLFSVMLRRVALVRTYLSEESSASIIRVTRVGEVEQL